MWRISKANFHWRTRSKHRPIAPIRSLHIFNWILDWKILEVFVWPSYHFLTCAQKVGSSPFFMSDGMDAIASPNNWLICFDCWVHSKHKSLCRILHLLHGDPAKLLKVTRLRQEYANGSRVLATLTISFETISKPSFTFTAFTVTLACVCKTAQKMAGKAFQCILDHLWSFMIILNHSRYEAWSNLQKIHKSTTGLHRSSRLYLLAGLRGLRGLQHRLCPSLLWSQAKSRLWFRCLWLCTDVKVR